MTKTRTTIYLALLALSLLALPQAQAQQFPYPFREIKQDPAFKFDNQIWGKIHELKVTDSGTDLTIGFGNQEVKLSVPTKLDEKVWKHNQTVYLDKNDGHLKLVYWAPHIA
ncbi:exported hypothetical protein [Burkholderia cenocepacia]|uniref:hypothetical protein n=1 Tax=Burkholderia cenocepacia TaxID=95486 RepID=UPI00192CB3B2|nr:hypothetical protein [Burkholderia cenocepacia]CAD9227954.1 exported hypothetical protein [Burkholderia cenocepacia]